MAHQSSVFLRNLCTLPPMLSECSMVHASHVSQFTRPCVAPLHPRLLLVWGIRASCCVCRMRWSPRSAPHVSVPAGGAATARPCRQACACSGAQPGAQLGPAPPARTHPHNQPQSRCSLRQVRLFGLLPSPPWGGSSLTIVVSVLHSAHSRIRNVGAGQYNLKALHRVWTDC